MQLTMGRPTNDYPVSIPARQTAAKPDPYRQGHTRHRRQPKSQPFDAEDLRQRLYLVIMEQEAMEESNRREWLEEEKRAKKNREQGISTKPGPSDTSFAARMARSNSTSADNGSGVQSSEAKGGRSIPRSIQDRLRRKPSRADSTTTGIPVKASSYHHIPQEAAVQFTRTATANSMRERNSVHSLSQVAVKLHTEGRASDKLELGSSITPAQQTRALERAQSRREKLHERNQFQNPRDVPDERRSSEESRSHRRHNVSTTGLAPAKSRRKSSTSHFGDIIEGQTLAVRTTTVQIDPPIDEISSEETLVVDPAAAVNEHRVDWTQSDEICEKPRSASGRIPLLKKADSLWTLKGKLGGRGKNGRREDRSEPPSQPKFSKLGFLMRLRR